MSCSSRPERGDGRADVATLTVFSDVGDGTIESTNATYATARSGSGLTTYPSNQTLIIANEDFGPSYFCGEACLSFDTSAIGAANIVSAAVLSLVGWDDSSFTDFIIEARAKDWGASLDTGDWVAGAGLGALTLLATLDTALGVVFEDFNDFTSDAAFASNINTTGTTRLLLNSSRHRLGTTPSGFESVSFYAADEPGTAKDPRLVVTYAAPGGAPPFRAQPCRVWRC